MISTATTRNNRGTTLGTAPGTFDVSFAVLGGWRMPVGMSDAAGRAGVLAACDLADYRTKAELRASDFGAHVSLRPAVTDVLAPITGHPAWSPPI